MLMRSVPLRLLRYISSAGEVVWQPIVPPFPPPIPPPPKKLTVSLAVIKADAMRIVEMMRKEEDPEGVLDKWITERPLEHLLVAKVLQLISDADLAIRFFKWTGKQSNFQHSSYTYNRLLEALVSAGRHRQAYIIYKQHMSSSSTQTCCLYDNYTFFVLIRAFSAAEELQGAVDLLQDMRSKGLIANPAMYNFVVNSLCKAGKMTEAVQLVKSMDGKTTCNADVVTFNTLMAGFCRSQRLDEAQSVLKQMMELGYTPNLITFNTLLNGLCSSSRMEDAENLMKNMKAMGCCTKDAVTYNTLIHGYCKQGNVERAYSLLREMKIPDTFSYTSLIHGLCKCSRLDDAHKLLREMTHHKCKPNVVTYNALINGLCKVGRVKAAREMMDEMDGHDGHDGHGCRPDVVTYSCMIDGLCKNGDVDGALRMMREEMMLKGCVPDAVTYNVMTIGLCKEGRMEEACDVVKEMMMRSTVVINSAASTYNALVDGLYRVGKIDMAYKLLEDVRKAGCCTSVEEMEFESLLNGVGSRVLDRNAFEKWRMDTFKE